MQRQLLLSGRTAKGCKIETLHDFLLPYLLPDPPVQMTVTRRDHAVQKPPIVHLESLAQA